MFVIYFDEDRSNGIHGEVFDYCHFVSEFVQLKYSSANGIVSKNLNRNQLITIYSDNQLGMNNLSKLAKEYGCELKYI